MDSPPAKTPTGSSSSSSSPPPPRAIAAAGPAAVEAVRNASMRCGGCGSKVGAGVLGRVLSRLNVAGAGNGNSGGGGLDDAAVVAPPAEPGAVMVHTVDFFRSFVSDPYIFGQIAANHALSDVHAMVREKGRKEKEGCEVTRAVVRSVCGGRVRVFVGVFGGCIRSNLTYSMFIWTALAGRGSAVSRLFSGECA